MHKYLYIVKIINGWFSKEAEGDFSRFVVAKRHVGQTVRLLRCYLAADIDWCIR